MKLPQHVRDADRRAVRKPEHEVQRVLRVDAGVVRQVDDQLRVFAGVDRARIAGLVALAGLAPVAIRLPPIILTLVVMVILAAIATTNLVVARAHPPRPAPR